MLIRQTNWIQALKSHKGMNYLYLIDLWENRRQSASWMMKSCYFLTVPIDVIGALFIAAPFNVYGIELIDIDIDEILFHRTKSKINKEM